MEARGNVSHQNKVIITQYNKVISIRHKAKFRQVCMQPVIKPWSSLTWDSSPVTRPTVCAGITWLLLRCPCNWDFFPCNPLSGRWGKSVHIDTFNPNPTAGVLFPFPHSILGVTGTSETESYLVPSHTFDTFYEKENEN